ncbi:MAG: hypothetical protein HPY79_05935 [Bacteroidales bacterium]|nr:hypothetical protein [Bacteroidales bacterium]
MLTSDHAAFVFVVCGAKVHIDTLHFSLEQLKKHSQYPIYVVTDSTRNEIPIHHDNVIDIETPSSYDHHQASIWLKTSLHKILPNNKTYCYLDSDVIALNAECNNIFKYYQSPITFAKDHSTLSYFSPYAVHCSCKAKFEKTDSLFQQSIAAIIKNPHYPPDYSKKEIRKLIALQNKINTNLWELFHFYLKFIISYIIGKTKISDDITINARKKQLEVSNYFYYPILLLYRKTIKEKTGYTFNFIKRQWTKNGKLAVTPNRCNHIQQALKETFNVDVPIDWQHWNGGVFVFDHQSHAFMEQWHQNTLTLFKNSFWRVRDQGTLIATVFQYNLQNHPLLPEKFNFIADFYKPEITVDKSKSLLLKGNKIIQPAMIHIYHHWGDEQWDVWQFVKTQAEKK